MAKHRGSPVVEARDVRFCVGKLSDFKDPLPFIWKQQLGTVPNFEYEYLTTD